MSAFHSETMSVMITKGVINIRLYINRYTYHSILMLALSLARYDNTVRYGPPVHGSRNRLMRIPIKNALCFLINYYYQDQFLEVCLEYLFLQVELAEFAQVLMSSSLKLVELLLQLLQLLYHIQTVPHHSLALFLL